MQFHYLLNGKVRLKAFHIAALGNAQGFSDNQNSTGCKPVTEHPRYREELERFLKEYDKVEYRADYFWNYACGRLTVCYPM